MELIIKVANVIAAIFALGAAPGWADQAAGDACASALNGDGKQIYAAALAQKPKSGDVKTTVENVVRELAQSGKISRGVTARDNAVAAGQCVRAAVQ